jgi:arylsulfatase A-like enzyme
MKKMNIILILLDDMGWMDLSCYGSKFYETPNIDRLAAEGMFFSDAYAACPVCSPSRASILTGKYPARLGVTDWLDHSGSIHPCRGRLIDAPYIKYLALDEISIAAALKKGGYRTWHLGKWHLGQEPYWPKKHGFDVNLGGCHLGHPPQGYFTPWGIPTLPEGAPGEYLTDRLTDEAIRLLNNNDSTPFFMNFWHYAVHTPIQAPDDLVKKYEMKARDLGLDQEKTFEDGEFFSTEHKKYQRVRRRLLQSDPAYAAMLENLDRNFGRLLTALDELRLSDNTAIIFTSDNGGLATAEGSPTCNAPLLDGKGWMYEGGTRAPLLIKVPAITAPGSHCATPVTSPDIYPTLLEIAGLPLRPEQHCDGVSMMPLLQGGTGLGRDAIYWHYPHYGNQGGTPGCSVRSGEWKLIEFFDDNRLELYNLNEDISESDNRATAEPALRDRLHAKLKAWRNEVNAIIPACNPQWNNSNQGTLS